jgi:hypothetical protein
MMNTFYKAGLRKALRRAILMSCWEGLYIAISRPGCDYSVQSVGVTPSCVYIPCYTMVAVYSARFVVSK